MWVTEIACSDWQSPERLSAEAQILPGNPFSFPVLRVLGAQEVILFFLSESTPTQNKSIIKLYKIRTLGLSHALGLDMM